MASYVVDTSVVVQHFILQTYTSEAEVVLNQLCLGDRLHIPEFCLIECANVFWKEVRLRGLPQREAERFIDELLAIPFEIAPVSELLPQALQFGITHQLAIYDSLYIALALRLNCPLITVDERQLNAATACGVVIKPITDFSA